MFTRTVQFEAVKSRQKVSYTCVRCNKKRSKVVSTEYTVNPFNKNSEGFPKSRQEVAEDVRVEQARRVAEVQAGEKCSKCKDEVVTKREAARKALA